VTRRAQLSGPPDPDDLTLLLGHLPGGGQVEIVAV